jgi:hypothetical protein
MLLNRNLGFLIRKPGHRQYNKGTGISMISQPSNRTLQLQSINRETQTRKSSLEIDDVSHIDAELPHVTLPVVPTPRSGGSVRPRLCRTWSFPPSLPLQWIREPSKNQIKIPPKPKKKQKKKKNNKKNTLL